MIKKKKYFLSTPNNTQFIICPLCNKKIPYKRIENAHTWICPYCSFIGFEYWDNKNIITLSEYLKQN